MQSISYPSRILHVVDVPEVGNPKAEFQYNFFSSDERVESEEQLIGPVSDAQLRSLSGRIPKFVKISFSPVVIESEPERGSGLQTVRGRQPLADDGDLLTTENLSKIQSELSFSNFDFVAINC